MTSSLRIEKLSGIAILDHIPAIAQLRLEVFQEFPHLYDSTLAREEKYLSIFTQVPNFLLVLAFDGDEIVGTTTALPLEQAFRTGHVPQLLRDHGYDPQSLMYFSQSLLKKTYRGHGIGVKFFEEREAYARSIEDFEYACFYGVRRPLDHPKRPANHVPLDDFWRKRGYTHYPELQTTFTWKDVDEPTKSAKIMGFWMKKLV